MKNRKKTRRQLATARLLAVCAGLAHSERNVLQEMLLRHAFLCVGNSFYIYWADWNECERRSSYLALLKHASEEVAEAWYDWAVEIASESLSATTLREVIVDFIQQLVFLRFLENEDLVEVDHQ